jgi:hypothetical protein
MTIHTIAPDHSQGSFNPECELAPKDPSDLQTVESHVVMRTAYFASQLGSEI